MNLQLCSPELSKLAKELGFDEDCYFYCPDNRFTTSMFLSGKTKNSELIAFEYTLPELELLKMWLREVHNKNVVVVKGTHNKKKGWFALNRAYLRDIYDTYEQALEEALKYTCNKLKEKQNGTTNSVN